MTEKHITENFIIMNDWVSKPDAFLKFNERQIINDAGKISHAVAEALALDEYEKFRVKQDRDYISDFDREVRKLLETRQKKGKEKNNNQRKRT